MTSSGTKYSKGDIVVISFPFSDFMNAKKRPMVVLAERQEDIIGCAITSNPAAEGISIDSFAEGSLPLQSKIKFWQIHTIDKGLILRKTAKLTQNTHMELLRKINDMLKF